MRFAKLEISMISAYFVATLYFELSGEEGLFNPILNTSVLKFEFPVIY